MDDRMSEISCWTVDLKREWRVGVKNGMMQELGRSKSSAGSCCSEPERGGERQRAAPSRSAKVTRDQPSHQLGETQHSAVARDRSKLYVSLPRPLNHRPSVCVQMQLVKSPHLRTPTPAR
jgi:hypothetical protein